MQEGCFNVHVAQLFSCIGALQFNRFKGNTPTEFFLFECTLRKSVCQKHN